MESVGRNYFALIRKVQLSQSASVTKYSCHKVQLSKNTAATKCICQKVQLSESTAVT